MFPNGPPGQNAASTPFVKRSAIYHPSPVIPDVNQQLGDISSPLNPNIPPRQQIYNPNTPPLNVPEQVLNVSQPLDPSIPPRPILYENSDSDERKGPPPLNIPEQVINVSTPLPNTIPPRPVMYESSDSLERKGPPPLDIPAQQTDISQPLNPKLERVDIYQNSKSGANKKNPISDLLDFHTAKTQHPHLGEPHVIPRPGDIQEAPIHRPDGFAPSQHGKAPSDRAPGQLGQSAELTDWTNFGDGVTRNQIYIKTPLYNGIPNNIDKQSNDQLNNQTLRPGEIDRNNIYTSTPNYKNNIPPDIQGQSDNVKADTSLTKGAAFDAGRRQSIYKFNTRDQQIRSNIAGSSFSKPTLGDIQASQGLLPSPSLLETQNAVVGGIEPPNEQTTNNQYHKDNQFRNEGFTGPLKYFDFFAIANWFRNVSSEIFGTSKFGNDPITKEGRREGPDVEKINKSKVWLATNFALAALGKGDIQGYGPANLIFNPLSLRLVGQLPIRGAITPIDRPTLGVLNYKQNLDTSVATGIERLLLMRKGFYVEVNPGERISKLNPPIGVPGFRGDLNGSPGDTLDQLVPSNPINIINTIDAQTGGPTEKASTLLGVHTNLYTEGRPYKVSNAAYPLDKLEKDFLEVVKINPLMTPDKLKNENLFMAKPFPGAALGSANTNLTYVANLPAIQTRDSDLDRLSFPDNVDVAFSTEDDTDGFIKEKDKLTEAGNYFPLFFEDLRETPAKLLYFRAFLKDGLGETFSVDWQTERYYGRSDMIPTYVGTTRDLDFSFDVVAFGPKDLKVMYKKLERLQSMVYPFYDDQGFITKGPIFRLRIGDLIATTGGKGLPCYINSLDFAYEDGIWNLETDFKVPRMVTVSIACTVLHEGNPGTYVLKDGPVYGTPIFDEKATGAEKKIKEVSQSTIRKIFKSVRGVN